MDIAWFDPAVLAEGVVDAVFVVAVSGFVAAHVGSVLEWIVSILNHFLDSMSNDL